MKKNKDELLSLQYRMEKSDIKQKKLEDRLVIVSKALQKSNRSKNILLLLFIFSIGLMFIGFYYFSNDLETDLFSNTNADTTEKMQRINDSLRNELVKLRSDIKKYKNNMQSGKDSGQVIKDQVLNTFRKDTSISRYEKRYAYVKKAYQGNGAVFIEVDYVEYFQGKKAVKMAREYGAAEYDIKDNGDTLYFLYNNYYIHNRKKDNIVLELSKSVTIRLNQINQISSGFSLKAFNKVIKDKPLLVLDVNNGIVYGITEQKLK